MGGLVWEGPASPPRATLSRFPAMVGPDVPIGGTMATQDQLDALHRMANIPASDITYTDELLGNYIDTSSSIEMAAARIWRERAAVLAGMVDTTESGSSRKLSQLADNALKLAAGLHAVDVDATLPGRSFTTPIERQ